MRRWLPDRIAFALPSRRILLALNLDGDLDAIARDDELGRKRQDLALTTPKRVRSGVPKVREP